MSGLFAIVAMICLVAFIIGIFSPKKVIQWGSPEKRTRKAVFLYYGIGFLVACVLTNSTDKSEKVANTSASSSTNSESNRSVESTKIPEKELQVLPLTNTTTEKASQSTPNETNKVVSSNEAEKQELVEFIQKNGINGAMLEELKKDPNFNEDMLLKYYKAAKASAAKIPKDIDNKDLKAKIAALNDKESSHYRSVKSGLSVKIQEKSGKTFFGNQFKIDVILSNYKRTKMFSDNYQVKKSEVYLLLEEPLFGLPVQFEKLSFSGIEPGEKQVIEITSEFGDLKASKTIIYPIKAEKKGVTYDSGVFSL